MNNNYIHLINVIAKGNGVYEIKCSSFGYSKRDKSGTNQKLLPVVQVPINALIKHL